MNDTVVKGVALAGVIALHGVAIVLILRIEAPTRKSAEQFTSTVFFLEPHKQEESPLPRRKLRRAPSELTTTPIRSNMQPKNSRRETNALPITDWREERTKVAEDMATKDAARSAGQPLFSKPRSIELPQAQYRRRADDSIHKDGEIITPLSDDCHVTNAAFTSPQLDPNRLNVVCKQRKKPTRGDLFDALKPKYLQPIGEPPAKAKSAADEP